MSMNAERALTPVLLDLMEHEKVIEQGLATFIDVGNALVAIRDGRKYRAVGHATFEAYCAERWGFSDRHARRVMEAADTAALLEQTGPMGPISERQVRHLAVLRDEPELMREAWAEAIDDADGGQPTGAQVQAAVERRRPPRKDHPATFSDPILDTLAGHVRGAGTVLDPFAGTGRIHELRDRAGVERTIGVELEPEWAAKHPDTVHGNALDLAARELVVLHREQQAREWEDALHTYAAALTERDAAHNARERALNAREQALTGHPARRDWGAAVRAAHYEQQQQARP